MPAGRPRKIDESIVNKLIEAFAIACTDEEACFYAGISKPTLYEYCQANPEFANRKEALKKKPVLLAKKNIMEAMDAEYNADSKSRLETSRWYLERKAKDEFSTRQETTGANGESLIQKVFITKEEKEAVEKHINDVIGNN